MCVANSTGLSGRLGRALLTWIFCLFSPVTAAADAPFELRAADARYRVVISGVPVGMEASIILTHRRTPGAFDLVFSVDHPLLKHQEQSSFEWSRCQARPHAYSYESAGFGVRRGGSVQFDWPNLAASGNDGPYTITVDTVDAVTLAMIGRCRIAYGEEQFWFRVAEPNGLKEFRYRVVGEEQLKTPAGTFDTIKVERLYPHQKRRTFMWAAPALDWFMIRMEHIENPLLRGRIELTEFTWLPDTPAPPVPVETVQK